ncbi:MAG: carbohydrate ABC transporter permease [Brevinema sp.]
MRKTQNHLLNITALLVTLVFSSPIIIMIVSSFKNDAEIFNAVFYLFPKEPTLDAYIQQFSPLNNITQAIINSTIITIGSLLLSLSLSIPAAYGLARCKIPFFQVILLVFLLTQILPNSLVLTPMYLMFLKFKILNTYLAPIFATATISIPFIVLIMRTNFLSIPEELAEASRLDGCSEFQVFSLIFLPLIKPGLITAASFAFVMSWNDLAYSITFNTKNSLRPLTAGIYHLITSDGIKWNSVMAYAVLLILPVIILFISLQKYIISGLTEGSVKE